MTYRKLLEALKELSAEQLDMSVIITSGCDENGNAEFFAVDSTTVAGNVDINSAADDLFEPEQPILLFAE